MPNWACTCAKVVICCRPRKLVTVGLKKYNSSNGRVLIIEQLPVTGSIPRGANPMQMVKQPQVQGVVAV